MSGEITGVVWHGVGRDEDQDRWIGEGGDPPRAFDAVFPAEPHVDEDYIRVLRFDLE